MLNWLKQANQIYFIQINMSIMKLLEKKIMYGMNIVSCHIDKFTEPEKLTNKTIQVAVQLCISDKNECIRKFGRI